MKRCYGQGPATTGEQVRASGAAANRLSGAITRELLDIEKLPGWSRNRELRLWHERFTAARSQLMRPPANHRSIPPLDDLAVADDDCPSWLEVVGCR